MVDLQTMIQSCREYAKRDWNDDIWCVDHDEIVVDVVYYLKKQSKPTIDPSMPVEQLRLHFGELNADEVRLVRAAIRFANAGNLNTLQDVTGCPADTSQNNDWDNSDLMDVDDINVVSTNRGTRGAENGTVAQKSWLPHMVCFPKSAKCEKQTGLPGTSEKQPFCGRPQYDNIPNSLVECAKAVIERWETPNWKDVEPTAGFIYRLRDAIAEYEDSKGAV